MTAAQLIVGIAGLIASATAALLAFLNYRRQGKTKIAEFRREWIEELRSDLAIVFAGVIGDAKKLEADDIREMKRAHLRIEMRLNDAEKEHQELLEMLRVLIGLQSEGDDEVIPRVFALARERARKIMRNEWVRLKSELQNWR